MALEKKSGSLSNSRWTTYDTCFICLIVSRRPLENCGLSRSFNNPLLDEELMTGDVNVSSLISAFKRLAYSYKNATGGCTNHMCRAQNDYGKEIKLLLKVTSNQKAEFNEFYIS